MGRKEERSARIYSLLIFATFFMYVVLTGAKNIYVAEKTTLAATGIFGSFTDLAATMEYYFYSYAVTQILLVFFIKKLNIKWYLSATIGLSALLTMLVGATNTINEQWMIFIVNGALQAGVWSCSMKVLTKYLPGDRLPGANKLMSCGPAVATAVSYSVAALFGENWRLPFVILGGLLLSAVALFFVSVTLVSRIELESPSLAREQESEAEEHDSLHITNKKRVLLFYAVSASVGFLVTAIFFFIYNNIDLYLKDIGGFDNTTAKLITVLAPLVIILGPFITVNLCEREKNFILVGFVMFGAALAVAVPLFFTFDKGLYISLPLLFIFIVALNGGRMIPLSIIPMRMRGRIDPGVYSATANSLASIASGTAPKLLAYVRDRGGAFGLDGWSAVFAIILAANLLIVVILGALSLSTTAKKHRAAGK